MPYKGAYVPFRGRNPSQIDCHDTTVLGLGPNSPRLHVQFGWLQGRLPRLGTNLFVGSLSQVQSPRMNPTWLQASSWACSRRWPPPGWACACSRSSSHPGREAQPGRLLGLVSSRWMDAGPGWCSASGLGAGPQRHGEQPGGWAQGTCGGAPPAHPWWPGLIGGGCSSIPSSPVIKDGASAKAALQTNAALSDCPLTLPPPGPPPPPLRVPSHLHLLEPGL